MLYSGAKGTMTPNKTFSESSEMSKDHESFWFPAKRYGWGWGPPNCWQGWLVLAAYAVFIALCAAFLPPQDHIAAFLTSVAVLTAALILICWLKGEKPQWRWGSK